VYIIVSELDGTKIIPANDVHAKDEVFLEMFMTRVGPLTCVKPSTTLRSRDLERLQNVALVDKGLMVVVATIMENLSLLDSAANAFERFEVDILEEQVGHRCLLRRMMGIHRASGVTLKMDGLQVGRSRAIISIEGKIHDQRSALILSEELIIGSFEDFISSSLEVTFSTNSSSVENAMSSNRVKMILGRKRSNMAIFIDIDPSLRKDLINSS
ncbi:MAG: hypothetical protein MI867_15340, partial [Pseudomonadales bacterium]|nr:hypothetical protein [Pseudomonadales bacterium]